MNKEIETIEGAGGGGKGGGSARAAQEAPNTLSSRAIVKVVEVLSEGEIVGIVGGGRGVYINDTPFQNADGSFNFTRAGYAYNVGLPDQPVLIGYENASAEFTIGTTVTTATPWSRTTSTTDIDAVKITIGLPQGLYAQNTTTGDMNGTTVSFTIQSKMTSSGTWNLVGNFTIDGKTTSATEKQYLVNRPSSAAGTWDVRVIRDTADSAVASLRNQTAVSRVSEILNTKEKYNNSAVVGIQIDAESVGNQIPKRSYLVKGVIVKVPSNYNAETRAYTGLWNGTFINAWTDNPAWVLYDLITNERYGLGEFISVNDIDKFSFYDAAVYNDRLVPNGSGGTEPRFTFNAVIQSRDEAYRLLSAVAGSMRSSLIYAGGLIRVLQDRPADVVKLVTKANVIDGMFDYKSTGLFDRHTAYNVTYADRTDRHLPRTVTVDSSNISSIASNYFDALTAAEARYGYNSIDITAFGATTQGQAIRHALWALDTELNQTEIVQFKMSLNGFDLLPGDIISLLDEEYVGRRSAGRIVSVSGTTVVMDRAIELASGSKIDVVLAGGKTIEQKTIVETAGTLSTITISSAFSTAVLPHADFIVTSFAAPRQFKLIGISQEEAGIVSVEAVLHDPQKFGRVELNVSAPAQIFSNVTPSINNPPTGLSFREIQVNDADGGLNGLRRSLLVSWIPPTQGQVREYNVRYRLGLNEWVQTKSSIPAFEITPAYGGTYTVEVSAVSIGGNIGPSGSGTYSITTTGGGASLLAAPTALQVIGGGTNFSGEDLNVQFTNPAVNTGAVATLRDFEVRFIETTGSITVRTVYIPAVPAGSVQTVSYTYAMNIADGGPRRSIQVQVRCRDAQNDLSLPATVTFTNPAPAVPSLLTLLAGLGSNKLTMTMPTDTDFAGILVWRSTTNGFTVAEANLVYEGSDSYIADNALQPNTTYYYKVAAFDLFGKSYSGVGLNISAQLTVKTIANGGIPGGASVPGTGTQGDLFFNTTDNKLYRYTGSAWTVATDGADVIANSITAGKLAANSVSATNIVASSITGDRLVANTITGDKIAADAITANKILAGTITATQLSAGAITATQIAAGAITSDKIAAGTITATQIAAGAITADKITVGTLSALSATLGNVSGGQFTTGSITGYAWPAPGQTGSYLGPSGLLIGNANDNRYFQVDSSGNVYAPGFSIVNGTLTLTNPTLNVFTASNSGAINVNVGPGTQSYGSRSAFPNGGKSPYTYLWVITNNGGGFGGSYVTNNTSQTASFGGSVDGATITAVATCFISDANGRVAVTSLTVIGSHTGSGN